MLTEDQAKEKACCKVIPTRNGELVTAACLASKCMAWRWQYGHWRLPEGNWVREGETFQSAEVVFRPTEFGYCGLADRPENAEV